MTENAARVEPTESGARLRRRLRDFRLPGADGREVRTTDFRQRRNLVVVFHHGGGCPICVDYLDNLADHVSDLAGEEAVALAVGAEDEAATRALWERLDRRLTCLADPSGNAAGAERLGIPAVIVADRFGQVWAAWSGGASHALPGPDDVVEWLRFVEMQCPE